MASAHWKCSAEILENISNLQNFSLKSGCFAYHLWATLPNIVKTDVNHTQYQDVLQTVGVLQIVTMGDWAQCY